MTIKVFEAFAGYGSQAIALQRLKQIYLDFDYEVVGISEIDKYAIQAYNAVHGETTNYGDISKIDWDNVPDFDLFTYSFPCQDISSAGKQRGLAEGSETRSSLLWECKKAIEAKKPKYLLMENVKALTHKKFLPYLHEWERYLGSLGYTNFTKVLNAKNYGVPQNRERVFIVSVLGDAWYEFPKPFELTKRLKDVLEKDVDEKYYLKTKMLTYLTSNSEKMKRQGNGHQFKPKNENDIAFTIRTAAGSRIDDNFVNVVGNVNPSRNGMNGNIYDSYGLSPTLTTNKGEGVKIVNPTSCAMRGRNPDNPSDRTDGIPTKQRIEKCPHTAWENSKEGNYRIRKLTPRECFRLMGVSDSDIDKIQKAGISRTQQYKLAGNSIVVNVLFYIFKNLFVL